MFDFSLRPEQGEYLGLDLGGTNFRVVLVKFKDGVADTTTKYYHLSDKVLSGPSAGVSVYTFNSLDLIIHKKYQIMLHVDRNTALRI